MRSSSSAFLSEFVELFELTCFALFAKSIIPLRIAEALLRSRERMAILHHLDVWTAAVTVGPDSPPQGSVDHVVKRTVTTVLGHEFNPIAELDVKRQLNCAPRWLRFLGVAPILRARFVTVHAASCIANASTNGDCGE